LRFGNPGITGALKKKGNPEGVAIPMAMA